MTDTLLPADPNMDFRGVDDVKPSPAASGAAPHSPPGPDDIQPVANETRDRIITAFVTLAPIAALGFVGWQMWDGLLHRSDLIVFAILYVLTGLGITVGFHRLFTHRSFKTSRALRFVLAVLGSAAIEGRSSPGSPTTASTTPSPTARAIRTARTSTTAWAGAGRCAVSRTRTWAGSSSTPSAARASATPRTCSPTPSSRSSTAPSWFGRSAVSGRRLHGLGYAIGGTWRGGLTGLLWGGAVRMLVLHHMTYSINSLCHFFGRRSYETGDHSRNLAWLALCPPSARRSNNNHHAFPTSASHGLSWRQPDVSALVIRLLA